MQVSEATSHLIKGAKVPSTGEEGIEVLNPATGEQIGYIPAGTPEDAKAAVAAARKMRDRTEELAGLITLENGKPLDDALGGVEAGIGTLEQYAELGPLHRGKTLNGSYMASDMMVHEPYGVAAVVVPWNDPIAIACGYLGAALVTGNTVVFKPSEKTPLSAVWLTAMFDDLPEGVLNLLLGDARAGWPLVSHEDADLVLFTGSVPTGREILEVAGRQLKKAVVELGGKDPMIVDRGVDPAWAAAQAAIGSFANTGQICTSVERIYVHEAVAEEFLRELTARAEVLRVGDGSEPGTEMGPLIDEGQRNLVHRHVREAVKAGAELRCGGELPGGPAVFGGAPGGAAEPRKASGLGFGYGPELLDEVTTTKVIHHAVPPQL